MNYDLGRDPQRSDRVHLDPLPLLRPPPPCGGKRCGLSLDRFGRGRQNYLGTIQVTVRMFPPHAVLYNPLPDRDGSRFPHAMSGQFETLEMMFQLFLKPRIPGPLPLCMR
jgi:hypothetical protein